MAKSQNHLGPFGSVPCSGIWGEQAGADQCFWEIYLNTWGLAILSVGPCKFPKANDPNCYSVYVIECAYVFSNYWVLMAANLISEPIEMASFKNDYFSGSMIWSHHKLHVCRRLRQRWVPLFSAFSSYLVGWCMSWAVTQISWPCRSPSRDPTQDQAHWHWRNNNSRIYQLFKADSEQT